MCFCSYSWRAQSKYELILVSARRNDTDEHRPHCEYSKLTSCVGWLPDSWLPWPAVHTILSACARRDFGARTGSFVLTIRAPCEPSANRANLWTAPGDLWGIICPFSFFFFCWPCCKFCKKLQNGEGSHSDPVTSSNTVKKSALWEWNLLYYLLSRGIMQNIL